MSDYEIRFTRKEAVKDFRKLTPKLQQKLREILTKSIVGNPLCGKRLVGDLAGFYSFRLTRQRMQRIMNSRARFLKTWIPDPLP